MRIVCLGEGEDRDLDARTKTYWRIGRTWFVRIPIWWAYMALKREERRKKRQVEVHRLAYTEKLIVGPFEPGRKLPLSFHGGLIDPPTVSSDS